MKTLWHDEPDTTTVSNLDDSTCAALDRATIARMYPGATVYPASRWKPARELQQFNSRDSSTPGESQVEPHGMSGFGDFDEGARWKVR